MLNISDSTFKEMKKIFKIIIVLILISIIIFFGFTQFFHGSKPAKITKINKSAPIEVSAPETYQMATA